MALREYKNIRHLVLDISTTPTGGMSREEAEEIVNKYFEDGWTLFAVFLVSSSSTRVQNEYILVK